MRDILTRNVGTPRHPRRKRLSAANSLHGPELAILRVDFGSAIGSRDCVSSGSVCRTRLRSSEDAMHRLLPILPAVSRREFLAAAGGGLGSLALAALLDRDGRLRAAE